jgi:hypothetical protein
MTNLHLKNLKEAAFFMAARRYIPDVAIYGITDQAVIETLIMEGKFVVWKPLEIFAPEELVRVIRELADDFETMYLAGISSVKSKVNAEILEQLS